MISSMMEESGSIKKLKLIERFPVAIHSEITTRKKRWSSGFDNNWVNSITEIMKEKRTEPQARYDTILVDSLLLFKLIIRKPSKGNTGTRLINMSIPTILIYSRH